MQAEESQQGGIKGVWRRLSEFLADTRAEMKKATFPSRQEVMATTLVVLVASLIFAVYLWLADLVIVKAYEGVYKILGS